MHTFVTYHFLKAWVDSLISKILVVENLWDSMRLKSQIYSGDAVGLTMIIAYSENLVAHFAAGTKVSH